MKYWRSIEAVTCIRIGMFFSSSPDQKISHFCMNNNSAIVKQSQLNSQLREQSNKRNSSNSRFVVIWCHD